jgi:Tol biopolymer transport system component
LFQVSAAGGEPRQLTTGVDDFGGPRFSPDGRALYFTRTATTGKTYNLSRLARMTWPGGEVKVITTGFDRAPGTYGFSQDGRTIYLTAEEAGNEKIYSVAAEGGDVRLAIDMTSGVYSNLAQKRLRVSWLRTGRVL